MQRAPANDSNSILHRADSPVTPVSPTQHGLDHVPVAVSGDAHPAEQHQQQHQQQQQTGGDASSSPPSSAAAAGARPVDVQTLDRELRRLSAQASAPGTTPSRAVVGSTKTSDEWAGAASSAVVAPIAGQRIAEYEQARTPSARKRDKVVFQVTAKRPSSASSTGLSLDDFPNEILTHIFSYLHPGSHDAVALVSKRMYALITTPHAWRMAFLRFFPGQEAAALRGSPGSPRPDDDWVPAPTRFFSRLTPLASWRSEYLLRTRLLRSLMSGKPGLSVGAKGDGSGGGGKKAPSRGKHATAVITYNSQLPGVVDRLHAVFTASGKKTARVVHGLSSLGVATCSKPAFGKLEAWGLRDDYMAPDLSEAAHPLTLYGMGDNNPTAVPHSMDVSHLFGVLVGEGVPGGHLLYRSMVAQSFKYLDAAARAERPADHPVDVPFVSASLEASYCSVWIAKTPAVPAVTKGMISMLAGSSLGIVSAYSPGRADPASHYPHSVATAHWAVSPGVPIVAIQADDSYTEKRRSGRRVWAVALNALGEVYCLQDTPEPPTAVTTSLLWQQPHDAVHEHLAWRAGRTAPWTLVEPTRRTVTADWFDHKAEALKRAASPSPVLSPASAETSAEQGAAEVREVEAFFRLKPSHFRAVYDVWDMRLRLEVDFAGGNSADATAENIFVLACGGALPGQRKARPAGVTRYTRLVGNSTGTPAPTPTPPPPPPPPPPVGSVFPSAKRTDGPNTPGAETVQGLLAEKAHLPTVGWQATVYALTGKRNKSTAAAATDGGARPDVEITCSAIDLSLPALVAPFEDPLLQADASSSGPPGIPGQRARWLAVGTHTGTVVVWNMREAAAAAADGDVTRVQPLRTIRTESPAIASVAVSSLYLVHGGSDGLVQAWDPLASRTEAMRTLNAPTAGRLLRQLVHRRGELASERFAAVGAVFLDPDPTMLRGVLSIGALVRHWSYSASLHNTSRKRQRRLRYTNVEGQRVSRRLGDQAAEYIASEAAQLRREEEHEARQRARLLSRFGVGLAGLTDDEAVRYAEILSQEAFLDEQRRSSGNSGGGSGGSGDGSGGGSSGEGPASLSGVDASVSASSSGSGSSAASTLTPEPSTSGQQPSGFAPSTATAAAEEPDDEDDFELQTQRAIRLSLMESGGEATAAAAAGSSSSSPPPPLPQQALQQQDADEGGGLSDLGFPVTYRSVRRGGRAASAAAVVGASEEDDLQLALRLSLQEEEARGGSGSGSGGGSGSGSRVPDASAVFAAELGDSVDSDAALAALLQENEFPALQTSPAGKGKGKGV